MKTNCSRCSGKMATFIAYLPGQGEVCMDCYREYAISEENKALNVEKVSFTSLKKGKAHLH
jgi:hypothetical protein